MCREADIFSTLKIILLAFVINLKSRMIYRWDFILAVIIKGVEVSLSYFLLEFLLRTIGEIENFARPQMLLLFGVSELAFALWHCFFINSLAVGTYIREGMMDRFFLRPMNVTLQILLDGFDEDGWGALIVAFAVLMLAHSLGAGPSTFSGWLMLLLFAVAGALVYFAISLLLACTSVLAKTDTNLGLLISDLRSFARFPLTLYPRWLRVLLSTAVPLAVCGYWPTAYFLEGNASYIFLIIITSLLFLAASIFLFKLFLRTAYEGTGT